MTEGTKVMEVKGYFADDGKFFTDEEQCRDYEMNQLERKLFNICLDLNFEKTEYIDDILYFMPKTKKDIKNFLEVNEYYGYTADGITLDSPITIYKYDNERNEYIDLLQQCKELITEINTITPNTIPENIF